MNFGENRVGQPIDPSTCEQLPSSVEEGKAEAAAEAGVVLFNKTNRLINTTPALRATPPHLRRGVDLIQRQVQQSKGDRESVDRLRSALPADDAELDALIEQLLAENAISAFAYVVFAALAADRPIDARHLATGAGIFAPECLARIAMRFQGNVARYLLEALDTHPFGPRDRALILLIIAVWNNEHANAGFPPELFPKTRELMRMRNLDRKVRAYLVAIALYTKDEGLLQLLRNEHYPAADEKTWDLARAMAADFAKTLLDLGKRPLLDQLPNSPIRVLAYGETMRRSVAQVGRNQPCPCGSGRKYKRCCLEKDCERLRHSTHIAGVTKEEMDGAPERWLTQERLEKAGPYEMQKLDPLKLSRVLLPYYFLRLLQCKLLDRVADSFEKVGCSLQLMSLWRVAVRRAAISGQKDITQRLIDIRKPDGFNEDELPMEVYFRMIEDDSEKCLTFIENTARAALKDDDVNRLTELAAAVSISKFPGLGIVLARGVAPLASPSDASRLMEHLLGARDRLNLPPEEPMREVLDTLWARAEEDANLSEAYRDLQENFEAQRRQTRRVNEELERSKRQIKRLERAQTQAPATPAAAIQAGQDISRYERKITHLEQEAKASQESEDVLRRRMQQMQIENEALKQKAAQPGNTAADSEIDREEEFFLEAEAQTTQPVRIIDFSHHFAHRLNSAPRHIARSTMAMLGRLASGEPAAFVGAVRLKACPSVMRHRIGSDWRLLFRLLAGRVDAIDLIPRQDLERRIKTLPLQIMNGRSMRPRHLQLWVAAL